MTTPTPQPGHPVAAPTPGQTVGPFFGIALPYPRGSELVSVGHPDAVRLRGRVLDGVGNAVPDALVELWQPDPDGAVVQRGGSLRRDGWTFTGWGRTGTDNLGAYSFTTLTPGRAGGRAPFFALTVFARGLLDRLFTRAYLRADAASAAPGPASDPLLSAVPPERRDTLLAARDEHGFVFDIHLQGERETVFLTYPGHSPWAIGR